MNIEVFIEHPIRFVNKIYFFLHFIHKHIKYILIIIYCVIYILCTLTQFDFFVVSPIAISKTNRHNP